MICKTGTDFWEKAIKKEMTNIIIAFKKIDGVMSEKMRTRKIKPGYKYCSTCLSFDIEIDGKFRRKA